MFIVQIRVQGLDKPIEREFKTVASADGFALDVSNKGIWVDLNDREKTFYPLSRLEQIDMLESNDWMKKFTEASKKLNQVNKSRQEV